MELLSRTIYRGAIYVFNTSVIPISLITYMKINGNIEVPLTGKMKESDIIKGNRLLKEMPHIMHDNRTGQVVEGLTLDATKSAAKEIYQPASDESNMFQSTFTTWMSSRNITVEYADAPLVVAKDGKIYLLESIWVNEPDPKSFRFNPFMSR